MKLRYFAYMILTLALLTSMLTGAASAERADLTNEQANAIAMLNYIAVLTQDINASRNSRLAMEQAYSSLINNTNPNAVDGRTLSQLTGLLDVMEGYRMAAVKRDRLEYIYEQNQAQAIRAAVPNPLGIIGSIQSYRPSKLVASLAYMAVDSITSYKAYTSESELEYLKDGWALDDEEAAMLHESRKGTFAYMINMVGEYDLPGELTLTEETVAEFVQWKHNDNVVSRLQFLESNQAAYQSYGGYWLLLAQSYYENGDFSRCLAAIRTYEELGFHIFRKDRELADALPFAISAAERLYGGAEYAAIAARYVQALLDNTDHDDWALRHYAAQVYVDLYSQTEDRAYLQAAYDVALDNVNCLVGEQQRLNAAYIAPLQKAEAPADATQSERKQLEDANNALARARQTELPPVYEPLLLNCDLLFALADELGIPETERLKIDGILHPNGEPIFLTEALDARYRLTQYHAPDVSEIEVVFGGTTIMLPAACCTSDARITVSVQHEGADEPLSLTDWKIASVNRTTEGELSSYRAVYTSEAARRHNWQPDTLIQIEVQPKAGTEAYRFEFTAKGAKQAWYDYLKVWEGYKNNWYDYAKVWENSVVFERVE